MGAKKPVEGDSASQDWSKKKTSRQNKSSLEKALFVETPPNSKKNGFEV